VTGLASRVSKLPQRQIVLFKKILRRIAKHEGWSSLRVGIMLPQTVLLKNRNFPQGVPRRKKAIGKVHFGRRWGGKKL
jgi:hypothetical protein